MVFEKQQPSLVLSFDGKFDAFSNILYRTWRGLDTFEFKINLIISFHNTQQMYSTFVARKYYGISNIYSPKWRLQVEDIHH